MAAKRSRESPDDTAIRRQHNKVSMAAKRSLETPDDTAIRRQTNRTCNAKRKAALSLEDAISAFLLKINSGADCVCTCYHRMMYRQTVITLNIKKYSNATSNLLDNVFAGDYKYISNDGKIYIL